MIYEWSKCVEHEKSQQKRFLKSQWHSPTQFMSISSSVIKILFMIMKHFGLNTNTKYLALNLYQKFTENQFQKIYKENRHDKSFNEWKFMRNKIVNLAKLRLMTCIQLASKLDSYCTCFGISKVLSALELIDQLKNQQHEYSFETVLYSEFEVFKMIHYQIQFITPLDYIEILLSLLNFQNLSELRSITIDILDLTFLQHQQLLSQLKLIKFSSITKKTSKRLQFLNLEKELLFLSSTIIVCALSFLNIEKTISHNIVEKLSSLIYIDINDIYTVAYIIFLIAYSH
ncbi:cyclin N-terminal domain-containing protein 1 [Microplitis demolitor]|uniref:cyclin N-terminal domain-containing protein 1 n=1 Tax=Microplitis demolitor TaxID=69319 RepID=UPI0004CCD201|nr:cyclin N-terminal domain-containing protein 1 [Microplitis demolitor]